ncbi:MAG: hypothetical protein M9894_12755 [Planctomycetes bacterium]|nr:hypothetical protein [Planctomycetota bacterium]
MADVFSLSDDAELALKTQALDPALAWVLRLAALRRLEELGAPSLLEVAGALAEAEELLLRQNAVAVLVRSDLPAAQAAILRLAPAELELARLLAGGER